MTSTLLAALLPLMLPSAYAGAPVTKALIKPKQVTVYPNSARVVREGTVELKEGAHAVVFPDIPASVVESSFRVTVDGPKGTKFYGVAFKKEFTDKVVDSRTRKVKDQIQKLQDERQDITDKIESRQTEIGLLRNYGIQGRNKKDQLQQMDVAKYTESANTIAKRIAELMALNRTDERKVRQLDLKVAALNNQLAQGSAAARERRVAQADLEVKQAGTVRFKLTYQVAGASWTPIYEVNLNTQEDKPKLEFGFNGTIRQSTGEDWKDVTLTLSTSRPTEATQVPDPTNWWLSAYQAQAQYYRQSHGRESPAAAAAPAARDAAIGKKIAQGKAEELEPAELELAQTIQAAFAVQYSINVPKDIPSDGSDHRVGVLQSGYPVELNLVVVPRLSLAAYIEAKISYEGEQLLLPGPAQLFRDGDFIGNAALVARAPGETFDLGFGQDDLVRTERKKGDEKFSKGERRYRWMTTVSNYHPGARTIEVREQLPRTQHKEVKIDVLETEPGPQDENPEKPGLMIWKLSLKPKEKRTINFAYRVRFPDDFSLTGLEN